MFTGFDKSWTQWLHFETKKPYNRLQLRITQRASRAARDEEKFVERSAHRPGRKGNDERIVRSNVGAHDSRGHPPNSPRQEENVCVKRSATQTTARKNRPQFFLSRIFRAVLSTSLSVTVPASRSSSVSSSSNFGWGRIRCNCTTLHAWFFR